MILLIVAVHVFICIVLIAVILLQAGRGQGLSWGTFGGSPQSILGTKTASFMTRLTTICAILFLFTCIGLNMIENRKSKSLLATVRKPVAKLDFNKIKEALEKAEKEKTASTSKTPQPTQTAPAQATPAPSAAAPLVATPSTATSTSPLETATPKKQ